LFNLKKLFLNNITTFKFKKLESKETTGKVFDLEIIKRVFQFVKPYQKWFVLLVFLTLFSGVLAPIRPYLVQLTVDRFILAGNQEKLVIMCLSVFSVIILQALIEYANGFLSSWLGQNVIRDVRIKLYEHLLKLRLTFYDRTPVGRLITRSISDIETISDIFTEGLADIAASMLQLTFITGLMFYLNWQLTLVSLSVIPVLLLSTYIFKEKVKKSFNEVRTAVANLNSFAQEHITGMSIVQIFNREEQEYQKFKQINEDHKKSNLKSVLYYSIYFPVVEVLTAVGIGLTIWWGAAEVIDSKLTFGTLIAFIMYIQMFFRPIREIADKFNTLQMGIVGSSRVIKLLDDDEFLQKNGTYTPSVFESNITFKNVFFAYKDQDLVLKNISFEVKQGQILAFVGATGAGKSSIINLINRFYEIHQGEILIGNRNIMDYDISFLRGKIAMVLQDVFLFSGTVEENIILGNQKISKEKIRQAAQAVDALDFIEKLPNGFNYSVMERGATLSVGQRQLISFIRAMVLDPEIIVLDEATASIDSETEEMIQKAMQKLLYGRTSIVIAHRLSTIQKADKIIVLDKGEIIETGTHDELLKLNGKYAQLYRMQYQNLKIDHTIV
jgi:ATP-binding cassette, subfamily B, multidrug efflux pump